MSTAQDRHCCNNDSESYTHMETPEAVQQIPGAGRALPTGRAIGDGPDLLFLSSLSKEDRHEAKAMIKEQTFLKAKTVA